MDNLKRNEINFRIAKKRVQKLKNFYSSVGIFIVVFTAYILRKYYLTGKIFFLHEKNISIIFWVWAIILTINGAKLFFLNAEWERKMLDKQLKQNKHGNL